MRFLFRQIDIIRWMTGNQKTSSRQFQASRTTFKIVFSALLLRIQNSDSFFKISRKLVKFLKIFIRILNHLEILYKLSLQTNFELLKTKIYSTNCNSYNQTFCSLTEIFQKSMDFYKI